MRGIEKLLGDDVETRKLLAAARAVPNGPNAVAARIPRSAVRGALETSAHSRDSGICEHAGALLLEDHAMAHGNKVAGAIGHAAKLLPRPPTRVAELETQVTTSLESLLHEVRSGLERGRRREAVENDRAFAKAQRTRIEGELNYWRMSLTGGSRGSGNTMAPARPLPDDELLALKEQLGTMGSAAARVLGPSPLPNLVSSLLDSCQRHHAVARGMDKILDDATPEGRALNVTTKLGQLLLEAERDCQALALALASGDTGAPGEPPPPELLWAQRLEASLKCDMYGNAAASDPSFGVDPQHSEGVMQPRLESLVEQLQAENEILRREIQELRRFRDEGEQNATSSRRRPQ